MASVHTPLTTGAPSRATAAAPSYQALLILQGLYFFATGVWPLVHMESFLAVTGPKTDLWLVRTVGVLVAVIGATLLLAAYRRRLGAETAFLAVGGALGLMAIDVIYVSLNVIPPIYLLDAVAEALLIVGWVVVYSRSDIGGAH